MRDAVVVVLMSSGGVLSFDAWKMMVLVLVESEAVLVGGDVLNGVGGGYDVAKVAAVIRKLQLGEPLPASNLPHPLKGEWKGYWKCRVEPDWLLIYKVSDDEVRLARTGTHGDLFVR